MSDSTYQASVVIPAYNEQTGIGPLLEKMIAEGLNKRYQIIVVDDGSTDDTAAIISKYPVTLVKHGNNKGFGASLKTGIRKASCDKVMMLDSDGQHDPAYLEQVCALLDGYDMVIGERDQFSSTRRFQNAVRLISVVGDQPPAVWVEGNDPNPRAVAFRVADHLLGFNTRGYGVAH